VFTRKSLPVGRRGKVKIPFLSAKVTKNRIRIFNHWNGTQTGEGWPLATYNRCGGENPGLKGGEDEGGKRVRASGSYQIKTIRAPVVLGGGGGGGGVNEVARVIGETVVSPKSSG